MKWLTFLIVIFIGIHAATPFWFEEMGRLADAVLGGVQIGLQNYIQSEAARNVVGGGEKPRSRYPIVDLRQN